MSGKAESLSGIKVLEIGEGIAGPVCGMQLADLGADVIKVEPPKGDRARQWGPRLADGQSAIFAHLNRGKRSVSLNLTSLEDLAVLDTLIAKADIVVAHFDPAEDPGIDWVRKSDECPSLIVCEISGLGKKGPYANRPASELVVQALAGYTRYAGTSERPARVGYEIASVGTGMAAVQGILAALYARFQSGMGDYVSISLLGQLISMKQILLSAQSDPDIWEGFHLNGPHWVPDIGWVTQDGQVTFDFRHGLRDEWASFCRAVGLERLTEDPEYEDWRSTIYMGDRKASHGPVYQPVFAGMTSTEASDLINSKGGISVKFHDYGELMAHPQLDHLSPFVSVPDAPEGARRQIATPFQFVGDTTPEASPTPAPRLGSLSRKDSQLTWKN